MIHFARYSRETFSRGSNLCANPTFNYSLVSNVPIPSAASRRQAHLVGLAQEWLCRRSVCLSKADCNDHVAQEKAELSAFFAAIAASDMKERERTLVRHGAEMDSKVDEAVEEQKKQHQLVDLDNCCSSSLLHDWSVDRFSKTVFTYNERKRTMLHYSHPCNHGKQVTTLTNLEAQKHGKPSLGAHSSSCIPCSAESARKPIVNALMSELLQKHAALRSTKPSDQVATAIEQSTAQRELDRAVAAQEAELERKKQIAQAQKANQTVFSNMIDRAQRTLALESDGSGSDEGSSDEGSSDEESSELCGAAPSSPSALKQAGEHTFSQSDEDSSESATFSDEPKRFTRARTYAQVVAQGCHKLPSIREGVQVEKEESTVEKESPQASVGAFEEDLKEQQQVASSNQTDEPADETVKDADETGKQTDAVVADGDANKEPLPFGLCESSFEAMVPIMESTDSFDDFEDQKCEYIMQWADSAKTRIFIFQHEEQAESTYFGLMSTMKSVYRLLASVEL